MLKTQTHIAQVHARCADIRKDAWNKAADKILAKYDTVYLGNWKDENPEQKRKHRDKPKHAFAESDEKRANGEAAHRTTHERVNRDNALGIFRQTLEEKARRSKTPKTVVMVNECTTTRGCARCGALVGPTGIKCLSRKKWTCPECGFKQRRDCSAAWNILQAGKRQQAGGQPVTGGRNPSVAGGSQGPGASVPGIEQTASGQVVSSSGGVLARHQPTVSQGDDNIHPRGPSRRKHAGPPPLA